MKYSGTAFLLTILTQTATAVNLSTTISNPFNNVLCAVWQAIQTLGAPLAAVVIIAAAAIWVYSRDDAGKRNAAKTWIVHAIIGIIVILIAISIITSIAVDGTSLAINCP